MDNGKVGAEAAVSLQEMAERFECRLRKAVLQLHLPLTVRRENARGPAAASGEVMPKSTRLTITGSSSLKIIVGITTAIVLQVAGSHAGLLFHDEGHIPGGKLLLQFLAVGFGTAVDHLPWVSESGFNPMAANRATLAAPGTA